METINFASRKKLIIAKCSAIKQIYDWSEEFLNKKLGFLINSFVFLILVDSSGQMFCFFKNRSEISWLWFLLFLFYLNLNSNQNWTGNKFFGFIIYQKFITALQFYVKKVD